MTGMNSLRYILSLFLSGHLKLGLQVIPILIRSRFASENKIVTATIGNVHVTAPSYSVLIELYNEIFVREIYSVALTNSNPLIIDGGANIGMATLYFKTKFPGATIHAFEPDARNFELLKTNVKANSLHNVIEIECALSDKNGSVPFFIASGHLNSSIADQSNIHVLSKRLSSVLGDSVADLVKLDIEGGEALVIQDLVLNQKLEQVRNFVIEFHPRWSGVTEDQFVKQFTGNGFTSRVIERSPITGDVVLHFHRPTL